MCIILSILKYCFSCLGWSRSAICYSSSHHFRAKCWPNRIVCNSTSRHFDIRYWHESCLQLNMSSFWSKMLRCWVACNLTCPHFPTRCWDVEFTATQQVVMLKQNVKILSCIQLSKSLPPSLPSFLPYSVCYGYGRFIVIKQEYNYFY